MSAAQDRESGYELLEKIASGGMATVYRGVRRGASGFSRTVAIKVPHDWVVDDPVMMDSLEREAYVASRLHHANVVSVMDIVQLSGRTAIVMEYVDGVAASSLLAPYEEAPVDVGAALRVLLDACAGIQAGHDYIDDQGAAAPIIHRDISPQNILIGKDGVSRVADFGIAKLRGDGFERTRSGVVKGKLAYLAPEYLIGAPASTAGDQFSLGVMAWEMLTGQRLFKGKTEGETMMLLTQYQVQRPSQIDPSLAAFDAVIMRALSRRPAARFPRVDAFAEGLSQASGARIASYQQVGRLAREYALTQVAAPSPSASLAASGPSPLAASRPSPATTPKPSLPPLSGTAPLGTQPIASAVNRQAPTTTINTSTELHRSKSNRGLVLALLTVIASLLGVGGWWLFHNLRSPKTVQPTVSTSVVGDQPPSVDETKPIEAEPAASAPPAMDTPGPSVDLAEAPQETQASVVGSAPSVKPNAPTGSRPVYVRPKPKRAPPNPYEE